MGDWGAQPWANDEAADWFHQFWTKGFLVLIEEIRNFDAKTEGYDSFRAASYVLQTMGNPYIWQAEHLSILKELLDKSIDVLENLVNPPNKDWGFLEMWGHDLKIVESVRHQIRELRTRRSEIVS